MSIRTRKAHVEPARSVDALVRFDAEAVGLVVALRICNVTQTEDAVRKNDV